MAPQFIPDGQAFLAGRGRENAIKALAAAEAAGFEPRVVRATTGGYLVPVKVLDFYDTDAPAAADVESDDDETDDDETKSDADDSTETAGEAETSTETTGSEATGDDADTTDDDSHADTESAEKTTPEQPPKSGAGSGEEAWVAWAVEAHGYDPAEGLSRNEIIAKFAA